LDPAIGSPNGELLYDVEGARSFHLGEGRRAHVGVRAMDGLTLEVELAQPTGYFLHLLGHSAAFPLPRHVVEAHGKAWTHVGNIASNGPFQLLSWAPGASMVLVRNTGYSGPYTGNVERVELSLASDWSSQLEMYEADRLDVIKLSELPLAERDRARQRHAGEYRSLPGLHTLYVGFGVTRPPFDDLRVRQAFALAVDKEALAEAQIRGAPSPATGGYVPPGMPGHSPGIGLPYDPERSRRLLAEAGYPGGRGFPSVRGVTGTPGKVLGDHLRAQWRESLGIEVTWETVPFAALCDRLHTGEPPHTYACAWLADYPDPDNFLRTGHVQAHSRWHDEGYERLVEQARGMMDQKQRMALYQQADRILIEQAVIAPLLHRRSHFLVKPWVKRYPGPWKDVIIEPH
jgi:ABC-type oligopeptide transport system substrate-binding subunit